MGVALQQAEHVVDRFNELVGHLRKSSFYRCMLFGIFCSIGLFIFYTHMVRVCFYVMTHGECHGQLIVACFMALVRKLFGMCAMVCYAVSLSVVLWNVERLDAVLQVQEEIHELEEFKRLIDGLNAHDLTEEDSSVSIIQSVEKDIAEQKSLVESFFNNAFGESVPLAAFEQLAGDLEAALNPNRGMFGDCGGFGRSYKKLPEEDAVHMAYTDS